MLALKNRNRQVFVELVFTGFMNADVLKAPLENKECSYGAHPPFFIIKDKYRCL